MRDLRVALCGEKEIIYDQVQFVFKIYLKLGLIFFVKLDETRGGCG